MPPTYAAVTVDIIGSTRIYEETGQLIRPRLLEVIDFANERFREDLAVPFSITLGDEFQGLMRNVAVCPWTIMRIRLQLHPLKCRVGVGIGTVAGELAAATREMEGSAFTMSRNALDEAKQQGRLTVYQTDDEAITQTANAISMLIDVIQNKWTDKQWEAVRAFDEYQGLTRAGEALGQTPQTMRDRLQRTDWQEVLEAVNALEAVLKQKNL